jgi:TPR repeat protein
MDISNIMSNIEQFKQWANKGESSGHYNLALCFASGRLGVDIDNTKAAYHFEQAADLGDADSAYALGIAFTTAKGVDTDYQKAHDWFEKAVLLGKTSAIIDVEKTKKLIAQH